MWLRNVSYDLCVLTCCWWRHYNITAICSIWVACTSSLVIAVTCVSLSVSFVSISLSFWLVQCWNGSILFLNKYKKVKIFISFLISDFVSWFELVFYFFHKAICISHFLSFEASMGTGYSSMLLTSECSDKATPKLPRLGKKIITEVANFDFRTEAFTSNSM